MAYRYAKESDAYNIGGGSIYICQCVICGKPVYKRKRTY